MQEQAPVSSKRIFWICIGVLLGLARIQRNTSKTKEKYRLKFLQGAKNKEYIYHLHEQFKDYVLSPPFFDSKHNTYSFQTVSTSDLQIFANIFYTHHELPTRKGIGSFFKENKISDIALSYWFMDDGGLLAYNKDYRRKGLVLNTQGFAFNEVQLLSKNLNSTFSLRSWVKKKKEKPIIAFSGKEYDKIKSIIYPYIVPSMRYKLPCYREHPVPLENSKESS